MPRGNGTGHGKGQNQGSGRMGGPRAAGVGGNCICPNCGATVVHIASQPCYVRKCPKCGAKMIRN